MEGQADANGGGLAVLHDGKLPQSEDEPRNNFFFRAGTDGGRLLVDGGVVANIAVDTAKANGADIVMMLRLQMERMSGGFFPTTREYFRHFGLTEERVRRAKKDVLVMHPGPMNRGVEIASEVADGPYSVILEQVTNGVAVRMAVLYLLLGGSAEAAS